MSQSFSAFVTCFCLLLVNLIILLSWYFFVFGSALLSFCCRTLGLVAKFVIVSSSPAGTLCYTSSSLQDSFVSSPNVCFYLYLAPCVFSFFLFWTLWWRSMLDAFNAPARQPHTWTWSARRLLCRQVIQSFFNFLISC